MDTIDKFFALVDDYHIHGTSDYKQAVYSHYVLNELRSVLADDPSVIRDVIDYNMLTNSTFRSSVIQMLKDRRYQDIQKSVEALKNKIVNSIYFE